MHESPAHEDVELGDLENDAFLPREDNSKPIFKQRSILTRWIPPRIQRFFYNVSKVWLVVVILIIFVLGVSFSAYMQANEMMDVKISAESMALRDKLAQGLNDTAIPDFVLEYAPYVYLHRDDVYYPSDLAKHIDNTYATINFTAIVNAPKPLTLNNLNDLNEVGGENIFLSSKQDVTTLPKFLHGQKPDPVTYRTDNAKSCVVIVVDKGNGVIDAFYMYWYIFNDGPKAIGHQVGNHLGDWEHNMIRFQNGTPTAVWYSQHEFGFAFTYAAVQKIGKRPVAFSAKGSHANYAVADGLIPAHIVYDRTQQGKLWDPTLSAYYYTYSISNKTFTPTPIAGEETPVNYLYFNGRWGDDQFPLSKKGQEEFHGYSKWIAGPQGPWFKSLDRVDVCLPGRECVIRDKL
ncbi:hypothetical protein VTL71DRAFT_3795 [Oculimacula yallundae]|uniref:Vacuolar protein sorting-associated protein 62 n=1 Tax=Oculimacula yallundae TaxID=86028 RepID=A0ABR4C400_9HELO